jgi:hypothetical protein
LDTADSVMDTKRKIEFGVQQIIFKVSMRAPTVLVLKILHN